MELQVGVKVVKIRVYVPIAFADTVRTAMGEAGAGKTGNYDFCSTSWPVTGRFRPLAGSHPTIGEVGLPEAVEEEAIEVICPEAILHKVIAAVRKIHPYEEPAIDIFPLVSG